ncbi:hypothetical protein HZB03_02875 [Candidatus Woesearchaeota archaeon]|nr:hypothetical protein [Candidatus Woesearchaeota archaeon]
MNGTNEELNAFTRIFISQQLENVVWLRERCYQVPVNVHDVSNRVSSALNKEPCAAGTFLGTRKKDRFKPSIALIDILSSKTDRHAVIDDHSAWLFLCGRDVFGKSISSCTVTRGPAIVLNKQQEVLGYGEIVWPITNKDNIAIKNKLDRGDFLRREMTKTKRKMQR